MRLSGFGSLLLLALLATAVTGCSNSTTPTAPTEPVLTTDTFTGTLSPGGTNYHTFTARTGDVTLTVKSIAPPALKIEVVIGVYSVYACTPVVSNLSAGVGTQLVGVTTATTNLCIAVVDPGAIPAGGTLTYELTVAHY